MEFSFAVAGLGSDNVTATAQVTTVAWIQSLAPELSNAKGVAKKKRLPLITYKYNKCKYNKYLEVEFGIKV